MPIVLFSRVYGINPWKAGGPTYWWFDTPLTARFSAGKRYELVFSNFTVVSGTTWNGPNWLYAHPLYDPAEGRGYGRPYNVCDLLTVVDGSLRGSGAAALPMMLIRPRPERFLGGPAGEVEEFLSYTAPFEAVITVAPGATSYDLTVVYGASIRPTTFRSVLNGRPFAGFTPVPGGTETVAIPLRAGTNRLRLTVEGTVARGWKASDSDDLTFMVPSMP